MLIRLLFLGIVTVVSNTAVATEKLMVKFELTQDKNKLEQGYVLPSSKRATWSKGLRTSYLKLQCKQLETGETEKRLSSVDLFDGLTVTHQQVNEKVELKVVLNKIKPRLIEIRKLAKNECKDLAPIVTTITETYYISTTKGTDESQPFGQLMIFRSSIQ